jgi:predicted AAA+ superfamily ATPase
MKRLAFNNLQEWKQSERRKPLLLRGARQVGKSWLAKQLGQEFEHFAAFNFEKEPALKAFFTDNLDPHQLCEKLALHSQQVIQPGKSLLFFDEIQACPQAITALRYFKEDYPQLHVIAAGSLVDFALEEVGMPVGRLQFLYIYPLSFNEFLSVQDRDDLIDYINKQDISEPIHTQLLEHVKTYFWLGGMPEVVGTWLTTRDAYACQDIQQDILTTYQQDFSKYAKQKDLPYLEKVFHKIPEQLGNKFKYVNIDPEARSVNVKNALSLLCKAGIAHRVQHSSGQGLPLTASTKDTIFKVFLFDIGLAQNLLGLKLDQWLGAKLDVKHLGGIAEQFVAQEYIAYSPQTLPAKLFYWQREAKTSNAEIDFIFLKQQTIVPVEVKSGKGGTLKSMALFLQEHPHSEQGLRVSELNFSFDAQHRIESVPFYGINSWLKSPK